MTYCLLDDNFSACLASIVLDEDRDLQCADDIQLPGAMKEAAPERSMSHPVDEDHSEKPTNCARQVPPDRSQIC